MKKMKNGMNKYGITIQTIAWRKAMGAFALFFLPLLLLSCQDNGIVFDNSPRDTKAKDFVYLQDGHFMCNDTAWFATMLNYKVEWRKFGDTVCISPAIYYENPNDWEHADALGTNAQLLKHICFIDSLGFNTIRFCIDVLNKDEQGYFYGNGESPIYLLQDSSAILQAIDTLLDLCNRVGIRAMLLLKPPLDEELTAFTEALLRHCADNPTIFAYDFMNEPLYFDPADTREKQDAYRIVDGWRNMMNRYAPHQLFTIGFAEPIEVFEWDPSILPVDFVEVHTYHPLRVASEMYWYGHYCGKPWMVGETALPADGDSVPYPWQERFLRESFQCAIDNGAIGYGWWEFQDCPSGVNFEAQYTGILNHIGTISTPHGILQGSVKMEATLPLFHWSENPWETIVAMRKPTTAPPVNYYNMLGYKNLTVEGTVVDATTDKPIEGAVVRGWNEDWSVGENTFSDSHGRFSLVSNDIMSHFEISAPGYEKKKFDKQIDYQPAPNPEKLPERTLEYQQISYRPFLMDESHLLELNPSLFITPTSVGKVHTIELNPLQ
ncbi:MAG: carboxypeptidase-like regulatory domain-containing protein [Bacteroidales bacterium]|nr:carboxypeptidase-like regulatory domain-containing protein [Bacteroidales bacterium]